MKILKCHNLRTLIQNYFFSFKKVPHTVLLLKKLQTNGRQSASISCQQGKAKVILWFQLEMVFSDLSPASPTWSSQAERSLAEERPQPDNQWLVSSGCWEGWMHLQWHRPFHTWSSAHCQTSETFLLWRGPRRKQEAPVKIRQLALRLIPA